MTDTIRLLGRADDAGSFRSANRAIRATFEEGICRNTSVMAPCPEVEHAAEELAGLDGLCTGVHLTLTAEWDNPRWGPVLPPEDVPTLVTEDGTFPREGKWLHDNDADTEEMIMEAEAQIERLRELGFDPDYIDAHMGVTWVGDLDERVAELREREGLLDGTAGDRLPEVEGAAGGPDAVVERLAAAEPGTYLHVGHPCFPDDEIHDVTGSGREPGELAADRDRQRLEFMAADVVSYCEANDVEPVRFTDL